MTETQSIPWIRISVEAAAIVASILLAFAIDAWWEERGERNAEVVLMERLKADFINLQSALILVEEEHRDARDACIFFMNMAVGESIPVTAEVDLMVGLVFLVSRTFNPGSGAVASFHSSESSRLVRNQTLADKLLAWSGLVDELQEEGANLRKGVAERWAPYIASRVNVGPYIAAFGKLTQGIPSQIATPTTREPLTIDNEFMNHVLDRFKWQQIALRDIEPVHIAVEEILTLLEKELND